MPKIYTLDALQDDLKNKSEKTQFLGKIETPEAWRYAQDLTIFQKH